MTLEFSLFSPLHSSLHSGRWAKCFHGQLIWPSASLGCARMDVSTRCGRSGDVLCLEVSKDRRNTCPSGFFFSKLQTCGKLQGSCEIQLGSRGAQQAVRWPCVVLCGWPSLLSPWSLLSCRQNRSGTVVRHVHCDQPALTKGQAGGWWGPSCLSGRPSCR